MDEKKKILIIEDDQTLASIMESILSERGYAVRAHYNGVNAVEITQKMRPDLILLDIMLPDRDGYQLCRSLKMEKTTAKIPVLVVTALNRVDDQEKALNYGADDFLGKPFESERLLQKVEKLIFKK